MAKPHKINLNVWEHVNNINELDGYQSLIITPLKTQDGTQLPDIYFRKGEQKHNEVEDVDTVEWNKDIRISKEGGDDVYAYRVSWWFNNAILNNEYKQLINNTFNKNGFDVKKSWNLAQNYLNKFTYSARKTYIHKYVWNFLTSGMNHHLKFRR